MVKLPFMIHTFQIFSYYIQSIRVLLERNYFDSIKNYNHNKSIYSVFLIIKKISVKIYFMIIKTYLYLSHEQIRSFILGVKSWFTVQIKCTRFKHSLKFIKIKVHVCKSIFDRNTKTIIKCIELLSNEL